MSLIETRNLSVRRGDATLLDTVSCHLDPGRLLAVCGPNGAGKSTLLRCLSGEMRPDRGSVRFNDRPLASQRPHELARRRAVLPQQNQVPFDFTAAEIVRLGRSPHPGGGRASRDKSIAEHAMDATDCRHLADRSITSLSGGERQRVHLARVLAQIWDPPPRGSRLLLLDEPTNTLDLTHQISLLDTVRSFTRQGVGTIAVLHDLNLAAAFADSLLVLDRGAVVALDHPDRVLTPPLLRNVFHIDCEIIRHPLGHPHIIPQMGVSQQFLTECPPAAEP